MSVMTGGVLARLQASRTGHPLRQSAPFPAAHQRFLAAQEDDLGTQVSSGDLNGLASQNAYLKEALEVCRAQTATMNEQARDAASAAFSVAESLKE